MSTMIEFEEEEFTTQFNGGTILRILQQLRPYWKWVIGFLTAVVVVSFLESYFTYLSKRIIDEAVVGRNVDALWHLLTIYGGLILIQAVAVFAFIYVTGLLGERVRYDLRGKMFNHLQQLSLSYYNRTPVGWIMSRVTSDTDRLAELVTWGLLDVTWGLMNIAAAVYFMSLINWRLALMVFAIIPVIVVIAVQFKKRIIGEYRTVRKINSKITGSYNETITGVRVIKALTREERNLEEFSKLTGEMYQASYRAAWLSGLFLPVVQMISAVGVVIIVWYSGSVGVNGNVMGTMTIGGVRRSSLMSSLCCGRSKRWRASMLKCNRPSLRVNASSP